MNTRLVARASSAALASIVVSILAAASASALTAPASDPFYTEPASIAQYPHGTIQRPRQVTLSGPTQTAPAAAYQLMYATTDATGQPVAAVTTVMVPTLPRPARAVWPPTRPTTTASPSTARRPTRCRAGTTAVGPTARPSRP